MDRVMEYLAKKEEILNKLRERAVIWLENAPEGSLRISTNKKGIEYYCKKTGCGGSGTYIKKSDEKLVVMLAQKKYYEDLVVLIDKKINTIRKFLKDYPEKSVNDIYQELTPARQGLVKPIIITDEDYAARWQNQPYEKKPFREDDDSAFYTEKNERVRSKSEVIIANLLNMMQIPYRYECPLVIEGRRLHPDFTILDVERRREIYLEHCGMMDDPKYAEKSVGRISLLALNDICIGSNLICTFETSTHVLDTRVLKKEINAVLGRE